MGASQRRILSTLFSEDAPIAVWQDRVDMVRPKPSDVDTIGYVLRRAGRYDALVLDGSGHRDQALAALLALRRRRPAVVIADATWTAGDTALERAVHRVGLRMIDGRRTTFCVLSTFEVDSFRRTWGPLRGQTYFTHWPATLKQPNPLAMTSDSGRVFAGGNSLRDFEPLIAAASSISAPIDIATSTLTDAQRARCPSNVTAGPLPHDQYERLLFAAPVVVVPLQVRDDRGSGQTTYTNAMALGKAIVATDSPGVRDYLVDGKTGVIVPPGDPAALARAVQRLIDNPSERARLGTAAAQYASTQLTLEHYAEAVLRATDLTLARS